VRILLISFPSKRHQQFSYPLGLNRIDCAIRSVYSDARIDLIDNQYTKFDDLLIHISKNNYDFIGISAQLESQNELFKFLNHRLLKDYLKNRKIIVGGNLISNSYENILNKYNNLIMAIGEGENTIIDYIKYIKNQIKISEIRGIVYYDNKLQMNKSVKTNLINIIPVNKESLNKTIDYKGDILLWTSRGCGWGACSYCFKDPNRFHKFELLNSDIFLQELKYAKQLGYKDISITDPCVLGGATPIGKIAKNRMIKLCYELIKNTYDINIAFSLRADDVFKSNMSDDENNFNLTVLNVMKKAGFNLPFLGIETNSKTQLKRYNKGILPIENYEAIKRIKKIWKEISIGVIMFDPFVTPEEVMETINFVDDLDLYDAMSYPLNQLKIQKGTQFFNKCLKENLIIGYNSETLLYDVSYKNKKIQSIINVIKSLENEVGSIMYLAKLKSRSNRMSRNDNGNNILHDIHVVHNILQINLIRELIFRFDNKPIDFFRNARHELINKIKINIKKKIIDDTNKILLNEIKRYEAK